jgi:hypothetical protein
MKNKYCPASDLLTRILSARRLQIPLLLLCLTSSLSAQESFRFSGQLSSWLNVNSAGALPLWGGVRYLPQANLTLAEGERGKTDAEVSANIFGTAGLHPFDTIAASGDIKPYRIWVRYSTKQLEVRVGLQKLSFGSALMLRPLMWFDQLDPRDPLKLTDGVWGVLARYYFLNNTNIWLWGLYGNGERRGWEAVPANKRVPELGGRVQFPVPRGEMAFTYHHRIADSRELAGTVTEFERIPEHKFGFDAKWDLITGLWLEGSFSHKGKDLGILTNQLIMNAGLDYTFGIGNGLYGAFEQLAVSYDETPFAFSDVMSFSVFTLRYPFGLFDSLSSILYYNWSGRDLYSFLSWQKQYNNISLYLMAFWNPETFDLPSQTEGSAIFAGRGIQFMFVYNH